MHFYPDIRKKPKEEIDFGIMPHYTEISIYITSISLLSLFIIDQNLRQKILNIYNMGALKIYVLGFFAILAISIYQAFTKKQLPYVLKYIIAFYMSTVYLFTGITSFSQPLIRTTPILAIFPLINIVYSIFILMVSNQYMVSKKDAEKHEIIIGTIATALILLTTTYILNYHWSISLSIAITYPIIINKGLTRIFYRNNLK